MLNCQQSSVLRQHPILCNRLFCNLVCTQPLLVRSVPGFRRLARFSHGERGRPSAALRSATGALLLWPLLQQRPPPLLQCRPLSSDSRRPVLVSAPQAPSNIWRADLAPPAPRLPLRPSLRRGPLLRHLLQWMPPLLPRRPVRLLCWPTPSAAPGLRSIGAAPGPPLQTTGAASCSGPCSCGRSHPCSGDRCGPLLQQPTPSGPCFGDCTARPNRRPTHRLESLPIGLCIDIGSYIDI
ncbi:hypothetical protein PVAP13_2KG187380 [Panicum virgatum]|uniref:Uncharacterized protein n=1 Tax=Panicum virgatum TaxID=38727 RepID=A0A8T0VXE0_PANVG|nr:hypothetical protein PVAP13_2KG187380 [Panicum virgatum]